MCLSCYVRHFTDRGVPVPETTDAMRALVSDIELFYEDEPTGGRLHIVLDDWNLDDGSIQWCQAENPLSDTEKSIAGRLLKLTEDERHVVLGHARF